MSRTKKLLLAIGIAFVAIQFIRPARNQSGQVMPTDITKMYVIPDSVQIILKTACNDCHSNNSSYPWYSYSQPIGWLLSRHIKNGKAALNFSEFGSYSKRKQQSKLKSIADQINEDEMPPSYYKLMHKKARLTKEEKVLLVAWAQKTKDSLDARN